MECSLVMFKSDGTRKDIPLVGERTVVGRMSSCDVRIPLGSVSREHCELLCDGEMLRYRDLNSSNGVVHNGAKSKQGRLLAGDELVIGPVVFTVMIDGRPAKIAPIRTILDEPDDKAANKAGESGSGSGTRMEAALPLAPVVIASALSREIGSSGEQIEAIKADSDFEEFNPRPAGRQASSVMPAMPAPIGDDEDDVFDVKPVAAPAAPAAPLTVADSGGFEFVEDEEDDGAEQPAFTFD